MKSDILELAFLPQQVRWQNQKDPTVPNCEGEMEISQLDSSIVTKPDRKNKQS